MSDIDNNLLIITFFSEKSFIQWRKVPAPQRGKVVRDFIEIKLPTFKLNGQYLRHILNENG